jgi:hypothetical protein
MSDLEGNLVALGAELEFPPTPDLARAVSARVKDRRMRFALRPVLVAAAVALVVALATALAIPSARSAILRFFHLRGVKIERVGSLPRVPGGAALQLGERVSLEEAESRVDFDIVLPKLDRQPRFVYLQATEPAGGEVSLVFRSDRGRRVLLTEFRGRSQPFIHKSVGPRTRLEPVEVKGGRGFWLEGARHVVSVDIAGQPFDERVRLAGNVLVWQRNGLSLRLEGPLSEDDALQIARSVR